MIWYILCGCIIIIALLDSYTLFKGKPTRKAALKGIVNHYCTLICNFGQMILLLGIAISGASILALGENRSDVNAIVILNGLYLISQIIFWGFFAAFAWDIIYSWKKKKKSDYFAWVDKIEEEGVIKYTPEERIYFKTESKKSRDKARKMFPFIAKLVDKQKVI